MFKIADKGLIFHSIRVTGGAWTIIVVCFLACATFWLEISLGLFLGGGLLEGQVLLEGLGIQLSTTHLGSSELLEEGLCLSCSSLGVLHTCLLLLGHESLKLHHQLRVLLELLEHLILILVGCGHLWNSSSCWLSSCWFDGILAEIHALLTHLGLSDLLLGCQSVSLPLLLLLQGVCLGSPCLISVFSLLFFLVQINLLVDVSL